VKLIPVNIKGGIPLAGTSAKDAAKENHRSRQSLSFITKNIFWIIGQDQAVNTGSEE
jgi:hypothetical protein